MRKVHIPENVSLVHETDEIWAFEVQILLCTKPSYLVWVLCIWNRSKTREFSAGLYRTLNGSIFTFSRASDFEHILAAAVYIVWCGSPLYKHLCCSIDDSDIALLLAVASTHSPQAMAYVRWGDGCQNPPWVCHPAVIQDSWLFCRWTILFLFTRTFSFLLSGDRNGDIKHNGTHPSWTFHNME